jgi:hypothetical protein
MREWYLLMSKQQEFRMPAFVEVVKGGSLVFVPVQGCQNDPALARQVANVALARLGAWRDNYADLFEFLGDEEATQVVRQIDRIRRERRNERPTLPDNE